MVMSESELMTVYFYGVNIASQDGTKISSQTRNFYIKAAQEEIEKYFDIKLFHQLYTETKDYYRDDYNNGFPFVRTSFPVRKIRTMVGRLNSVEQIVYPEEWLQAKTSSDGRYHRQFGVVPNGSVVNADADVILLGVSAHYGLRSYPQIPNYWYTQYETGWNYTDVPSDLLNLVGKLAAIGLFNVAGDIALGQAALASQSLSIDGLSQSISTTASATSSAYSARIIQYTKEIKSTSDRLKRVYKGITFSAL